MIVRATLLPAFCAALATLLLLAAITVAGPAALALPAVAAGALLLLARPAVATGIAIAAYVVVEGQPDWGPSPQFARLYELIPGTKVSPAELLLILALVAVVVTRRSDRRPMRAPHPFTAALGLLLLGLLAGAVTGHDAGIGLFGLINAGRSIILVVLVPFLVVQVVDDVGRLRRALGVAAGLAAFKGVAGIGALLTGLTAASVGQNLTYFEAPANTLMLGFLCVVLACLVTRVPLPVWVRFLAPVVLAALTLSYRRSFWIAAVLGLVLVVLVAAGGERRRIGLPALVMVVLAVVLAFSGGGKGSLAGTSTGGTSQGFNLQSRLASINPTSIAANKEDRYRIDERRNVLASLRGSPVAGLGLGVPYAQRFPLSLGDITHEYVHVAALWWWMKLGLLGLLGYVALIGSTVWAGWAVWRRHADPLVRAFGVGTAAATVGYGVAELTGTFAGPDPRSSVLLGAVLGLLSAAYTQLPNGAPQRA
jgi:O-antigen ligase